MGRGRRLEGLHARRTSARAAVSSTDSRTLEERLDGVLGALIGKVGEGEAACASRLGRGHRPPIGCWSGTPNLSRAAPKPPRSRLGGASRPLTAPLDRIAVTPASPNDEVARSNSHVRRQTGPDGTLAEQDRRPRGPNPAAPDPRSSIWVRQRTTSRRAEHPGDPYDRFWRRWLSESVALRTIYADTARTGASPRSPTR